jgi:dolichol-phosphate mannosyltransferase
MRDMTSGFECFSRQAMLHVLKCGVESRAHFFQTEIKYLLRNYKWVEVPISYRDSSKGVGTGALREAFRNLWAMYLRSRRRAGEAYQR